MAAPSSITGLFSRLSLQHTPTARTTTTCVSTMAKAQQRTFSSTPTLAARKAPAAAGSKAKPKTGSTNKPPRSKKGSSGQRSENFLRVKTLRQNMFSPAPPPLRMARQRYLRHWTIHRAWQLFRRQQREQVERERSRMHAGMFNACEELRATVGPEGKGEGYLYRVAMEKKGVYGVDAIPIEYARFQTDSPAKKAWDHEWKR